MVASFKCEDVKVGDTLHCVYGDGCCSHTGDNYLVEDDGNGRLCFKPPCFERYGDRRYISKINVEDFVRIEASGPW